MAEDASARLQPCRYDTSSFASSRAQAQFSLQAELTRYRLKPELRTDISADFAGRPMLFSGAQSDFLFESNWTDGRRVFMIRRFSVSLLLSLCTPILLAQGDRGSIAGFVSDPSGSVIAGATI